MGGAYSEANLEEDDGDLLAISQCSLLRALPQPKDMRARIKISKRKGIGRRLRIHRGHGPDGFEDASHPHLNLEEDICGGRSRTPKKRDGVVIHLRPKRCNANERARTTRGAQGQPADGCLADGLIGGFVRYAEPRVVLQIAVVGARPERRDR